MLLKKRETNERIVIDYATIEPFLENGADLEPLRRTLKQSGITSHIHDKKWLEMIINWTPPQEGLPLTEMAKWLKLAKGVNQIDDSEECVFELDAHSVNLVWNRLNDERFKVHNFSQQFADFLLDFCEYTGKEF